MSETVSPETGKRLKPDDCTTIDPQKSMESLYPSSAKFSALNRRKMLAQRRDRNPGLVPVVSDIKQRVMSARMLRMKQLQNQLGEMHHRIAELSAENRLLKAIQKRQDMALQKYESSSAELPQLLQSHSEELRVWQTRSRNLQKQNKELQDKVKQKDQMIITLTDQNKHLLQLNKDKHLEERERLADRVKDLEQRLVDKDNDMKLLARRLQLESKTFKSQLHIEQQKYRDLITKLEQAHLELSRTSTDLPEKRSPRLNRPTNSGNKQLNRIKPSKSQSSLANSNSSSNIENSLTPTLPVFLEPPTLEAPGNRDDEKREEILVNSSETGKSKKTSSQKTSQSQIPKLTKLSPIHKKSASKKSTDSEFSDDGSEEFLFYNETNDVKTEIYTERNSKKLNELLDHKKHIDELATKLRKNSLTHQLQGNLEVSGIDRKSVQENELNEIDAEIRESMLRRESLLDSFCDDFTAGDTAGSGAGTTKKIEVNNNSISSRQQTNNNNSNKKPIDPKKKKTLLAALKEIDGTDDHE